ncbi:3955_t:CDS:2 [Diversispora eburnea]|uniref:3955_t:CDS:1 n=1 Tax=Diversispora eburnea TaxID=1213867 RepID=A0A9N9AR54_9GLOM|nr:3955_t:CDS:2 [Diversispora eburnea]
MLSFSIQVKRFNVFITFGLKMNSAAIDDKSDKSDNDSTKVNKDNISKYLHVLISKYRLQCWWYLR